MRVKIVFFSLYGRRLKRLFIPVLISQYMILRLKSVQVNVSMVVLVLMEFAYASSLTSESHASTKVSIWNKKIEEEKAQSPIWLILGLLGMLLVALGVGAIALPKSGKGEEKKRLIGGESSVSMPEYDRDRQGPIMEENPARPRTRGYVGNTCPDGDRLIFTKNAEGCPGGVYTCTNCNKVNRCHLGRWTCNTHDVNYCTDCKPMLLDQEEVKEEDKIPDAVNGDMNEPILRVVGSNQIDNVPEYRSKSSSGKAVWVRTHFMFMIDCSVSMKGSRWDSVRAGFNDCLEKLRPMKEVIITGLTFDNKPNVFCREKTPDQAMRDAHNMLFTGTGTNYKRCLEYIYGAITKAAHGDYLFCIILLSDGLGGYPDRVIEDFKDLREQGKKFLFYSIACETDDDEDMIRIARELQGEHFKVSGVEGMKSAFSRILGV